MEEVVIVGKASIMITEDNGTDKEVKATFSKCPVLRLFRREKPIDGDTIVPSLHTTQIPIYGYAFYLLA